jgi:class 3 adenylate cyclase
MSHRFEPPASREIPNQRVVSEILTRGTGTVLATESIHERTPDLAWKRKRRRRLKGVDGRVRLFSLDPFETPASGAEERRALPVGE